MWRGRTEEELGDEGGKVVFAGGDVVVAEVRVGVRVVEGDGAGAGQDLLLPLPVPLDGLERLCEGL